MLSYQTKTTKELEPGWIYNPFKTVRRSSLSHCLSLATIEDGWMINKDGSLAIGFEIALVEEERLDEDDFISLVHEFAAACKRLPINSILQKLDIYYDSLFNLSIPVEAPYFYKKSLAPYNQRPILRHQSYIFLCFFAPPINPVSSFLGLGNNLFSHPFLDLEANKALAS